MALIGYARVSTRDQNPQAQHAALRAAGCERIFSDTTSGKLAERPELAACLGTLIASLDQITALAVPHPDWEIELRPCPRPWEPR